MSADEQTLTLFSTRVRQMILQYQATKKENDDLYGMIDERDARIGELEAQLEQARGDYESLKTARMLAVTDGDMERARGRLAKLIREVDRCITLLSE